MFTLGVDLWRVWPLFFQDLLGFALGTFYRYTSDHLVEPINRASE